MVKIREVILYSFARMMLYEYRAVLWLLLNVIDS